MFVKTGVIIAGGKATRFNGINKFWLDIGGKPLLQRKVEGLLGSGIERVIVCTDKYHDFPGLDDIAELSVEEKPMGTAGCIKTLHLKEPFYITQGDSFLDMEISLLDRVFNTCICDMTMALIRDASATECSIVKLDQNGYVKEFYEKPQNPDRQLISVNTGGYIVKPEVFDLIPDGFQDISLNLIPLLLNEGKKIQTTFCARYCIDIGTPERYEVAQRIWEHISLLRKVVLS